MGLITDQKLVVFGGLGRQGASVATELIKRYPNAKISLVTRGAADSEAATKAKKGNPNVSVVTADLDKFETLSPVLEGAYGVFLVTAFWPAGVDGGTGATTPLNAQLERDAALNCFNACKNVKSVKHLVFSTLEDSRLCADFNADKALPADASSYVVPHFDGKGEASIDIINQQSETDLAVDFVYVGCYYGNWFGMKPVPNEDGKSYSLYLPLADKPHYTVDVADVGKIVAPLFERLPEFGATVWPGTSEKSWPIHGVVGSKQSGQEIADTFSEVCLDGAECKYVPLPVEAFIANGVKMGMPELVARDFGHMFGFFQCDTYMAVREKALEEGKDKGLTDFKGWLGHVKHMLYPPVATNGAAANGTQ